MPTQKEISRWLDQGIALHQKDRTTEARVFYLKVLTYRPDDPDANHLIGLIEQKDGHLEEALARITKARRLDPKNAELLSNLGNLYRAMGRIEDAVSAFRAGLSIRPNLPALHNNLGVAYQEQDQHDRAIDSFRQALKLSADYAEAHNNLGSSLVVIGRPDKAVPHFLNAIALAPGYAKALSNLEAVLEHNRAGKEPPDKGEFSAVFVADAYDRLGQIHAGRNDMVSALAAFEKALDSAPDAHDIAERQLESLIRLKRPAVMVEALEKLIERTPDCARYHAVLGQAHGQLGATEASIAALRRAVALDPDHAGAYQMLGRALSLAEEDALLADMEGAYDRAAPDSTARMRMAFTLAKAHEDRFAYERAFDYLLEANRIRRGRMSFSPEEARRRLERLREVFTSELMRRQDPAEASGRAPIFIVGMPRSGTTLIESILAAHGAVAAGGELDVFIHEAARRRLRDREQPPFFEPIGAKTRFDGLARAYLEGVKAKVPEVAEAEHFTDKLPDNFWNIGLIKLAFPEATIIHVRRDPADTCLSIFKTDFSNDGHRYAYDLSELGAYYNLYRGAMAHWDEVLPAGSIKTVDYEALVAEPETEIRRLVALCGLDWDDKCLSFHAAGHAVHTASLYQVRRPIYGSSVNLAELYGDGLRPLLDSLQTDEDSEDVRAGKSAS